MNFEDVLPPLTPELNVRDLNASLDFYVRLLGFSIQFERREQGFAAISREGAAFMLEQTDTFEAATDFTKERKWITAKLEYPFGRGLNFLIHSKDLDALHSRLLEHDYPIRLPMEERWYRVGNEMVGVRQFMVMDPDGYLLRFDKNIGRKPVA